MKNVRLMAILIVSAMAMAACDSEETTAPTTQPTAEPVEEGSCPEQPEEDFLHPCLKK